MKKIKAAKIVINEDDKKVISHPSEYETDVHDDSIAYVYTPYTLIEHFGKTYITSLSYLESIEKKMMLDEAIASKENDEEKIDKVLEAMFGGKKKKVGKKYNPFKVKYLFEKIAQVDTTNIDSILNFCDTYGLLGEDIEKNINSETVQFNTARGKIKARIESLDYFIQETKTLKECIEIYYALENNDEKIIKKYARSEKKQFERFAMLLNYAEHKGLTNESSNEILKNVNEFLLPNFEELFGVGMRNFHLKKKLMDTINGKLTHVSPCIQLGPEGKLIYGQTSTTLLGVAYYQLYELITEGPKFNKCLKCGSYFVPRKKDAKFCPPDEPGKHSSCENSYNQMKHRAKKSILSGKKTVQDVAKALKRPVSEIEEWIKNAKK